MFNPNIQPYNIFSNGFSNTIVQPDPVSTWNMIEINRAFNEFKKLQNNIYDEQMCQDLIQKMQQMMYKPPLQLPTTPPIDTNYNYIGIPVLQNTIASLSEITGWNIEAVTLTVLSFLNAAMRGRFIVHANANWQEHTPLYTMLVAESGTMKSKAFEILCTPFTDMQRQLIKEYGDISSKEKTIKCLKKGAIEIKSRAYIRQLLNATYTDDGCINKNGILDICQKYADEVREFEDIGEEDKKASSIITDISTDINLMKKMMSNGGGISIISTESGNLIRRYCNGTNNNDLLNKAYDAEPISYGSEKNQIEIAKPFLTVMLVAQMDLAYKFFHKPTVEDSGLGARFMTIIPTQLRESNPLAEEVAFDAYYDLITDILEECIKLSTQGKFIDLYLTDGASRVLQGFRNEIQDMMHKEDTQLIKYTLRKLAGTTLRIASTQHCSERWYNLCNRIDEQTMANAVQLAKYECNCKTVLCAPWGYTAVANARKILNWVRRHRHHVFTSRDIAQQTEVRKNVEIFAALDVLEKHNIISQVVSPKRARLVGVNPCLLQSEIGN